MNVTLLYEMIYVLLIVAAVLLISKSLRDKRRRLRPQPNPDFTEPLSYKSPNGLHSFILPEGTPVDISSMPITFNAPLIDHPFGSATATINVLQSYIHGSDYNTAGTMYYGAPQCDGGQCFLNGKVVDRVLLKIMKENANLEIKALKLLNKSEYAVQSYGSAHVPQSFDGRIVPSTAVAMELIDGISLKKLITYFAHVYLHFEDLLNCICDQYLLANMEMINAGVLSFDAHYENVLVLSGPEQFKSVKYGKCPKIKMIDFDKVEFPDVKSSSFKFYKLQQLSAAIIYISYFQSFAAELAGEPLSTSIVLMDDMKSIIKDIDPKTTLRELQTAFDQAYLSLPIIHIKRQGHNTVDAFERLRNTLPQFIDKP